METRPAKVRPRAPSRGSVGDALRISRTVAAGKGGYGKEDPNQRPGEDETLPGANKTPPKGWSNRQTITLSQRRRRRVEERRGVGEMRDGGNEVKQGPQFSEVLPYPLGPGSWADQASARCTVPERSTSTALGRRRGARGFCHEGLVPHGHAITPAALPSQLHPFRTLL
ncbi:hypothetical protein PGTUg99_027316 [Puccinia graminis f. sp. tritici]|uniref:Uncharacterized protein n=1 Tax=Puccinia graminis f. sp. tritici TaxID=56615 RepID=A0A5B0RX37_PUCGR|nr:hypothetical protein PGTUg99_027316 [Puccinia graminis f. sp. tritici]